jgi:hypothetical protein
MVPTRCIVGLVWKGGMLETVTGNVSDGSVLLYSKGLRQNQKLKREKSAEGNYTVQVSSPLKFRITNIIIIF